MHCRMKHAPQRGLVTALKSTDRYGLPSQPLFNVHVAARAIMLSLRQSTLQSCFEYGPFSHLPSLNQNEME